MVKYCNIPINIANDFLIKNKVYKEQVSINPLADMFLGCYLENKLIGIVGLTSMKKTSRIKQFFVIQEERGKGFGSELLKKIIKNTDKKITAFATEYSIKLFLNNNFIIKRKNSNNIYFIERN